MLGFTGSLRRDCRDCRDCRDALAHLIASTIGPMATCAIGAKSFKPWQ